MIGLRLKPVAQLSRREAARELTALGEEISTHDQHYHGADAPLISDAEYDGLRRRLDDIKDKFPELAGNETLSERVGAAPAGGFSKVTHSRPMLSLSNAFDGNDVQEFADRVRRFLLLAEDSALALVAEPAAALFQASSCFLPRDSPVIFVCAGDPGAYLDELAFC